MDTESNHPAIVMTVVDPDGEPWNGKMIEIFPSDEDVDTNLDNYRNTETDTIVNITEENIEFSITFSLIKETKIDSAINVARTIWVIIVITIAALHFNNATNRLVLHPLERMLEIVKKIAKDPASAAAQEEMDNAGIYTFLHRADDGKKKLDENMETAILEQAIQKIGHLLTLGFGDAGSQIIASNISSGGDMNPMVPGQRTYAILGFAYIKNF